MAKLVLSPARVRNCLSLSKILPLKDAAKLAMLTYEREERAEITVKPWNLSVEIRPATSDVPVLRKILLDQEYSPPRPLAPAAILDAGAYIGISSLYFHFCFPNAQIIALEPDPETFRLLERNTRSIPQIKAVNAALWSSEKAQCFVADPEAPWASRVAEGTDEGNCSVKCMTLSEAANMAGGHFDLMKFDIEGGEAEVFHSVDENLLRQVKAIVIEFHDRFFPGSSKPFLNAIAALPHVSVMQGENSWFLFDQTSEPSEAP